MKKPDKHRKILEALESVLEDRRYDEVTLDAVAEAGGVGKGTIYRYFEDKEDLFFQLVQGQLQSEVDAVLAVGASERSPREQLVAAAEAISEHILRHHSTIRTAMGVCVATQRDGCREIMGRHHTRVYEALAKIVQNAVDAGVIRPDVDVGQFLNLYRGSVLASSLRTIHGGEPVSQAGMVAMLLAGVGA